MTTNFATPISPSELAHIGVQCNTSFGSASSPLPPYQKEMCVISFPPPPLPPLQFSCCLAVSLVQPLTLAEMWRHSWQSWRRLTEPLTLTFSSALTLRSVFQ